MKKLSAGMELKETIRLLESEQDAKKLIIKEHLYLTYDSLKPVNILKKTLMDISSSPHLVDNMLGAAMGISSGFISNKLFVGGSGSVLRKILGTILQFGVTNAVAQHPEKIKSVGHFVIQLLRRKKNMKPKPVDS